MTSAYPSFLNNCLGVPGQPLVDLAESVAGPEANPHGSSTVCLGPGDATAFMAAVKGDTGSHVLGSLGSATGRRDVWCSRVDGG